MPKHTNALIHESSPYLLQHAHNPVNWHAWKPEVMARAKAEDKLVLVSIGYSACHWCHVMEHESFEDEVVAAVMNEHFINIKIDREERPDIDMVYMTAVQLMTGQGGWPLNCFILPDGRPIFGGTYFRKEQWVEVLHNLAHVYRDNRPKALEYAENLTNGMQQVEQVIPVQGDPGLTMEQLDRSVSNWKKRLDYKRGGPNRAPKFPLPNNYRFLLAYAHLRGDEPLMAQVHLTLSKMARGGIYDALGGGFARYSTDVYWKVPHFEKMLYDNAQLVTLYCEAYRQSSHALYREVVFQTLDFVERELTSPEHAFYSALDADSEGEEGKYYVWQKEELAQLLGDDFALFSDYYNINDTGYWEHGHYILVRCDNESEVAVKHQISLPALQDRISTCRQRLLEARDKRVRPGLDDKCLTSWNALMCKAFADAYLTFGHLPFKQSAIRNAAFIRRRLFQPAPGEDASHSRYKLWHAYKNGKATINGFLEDYAFVADAFLSVYLLTEDELWLSHAEGLTDYALAHFYDEATGLFFFTDGDDDALIVRKKELHDNVIPASNSQTALNLFRLSHYSDRQDYRDKAIDMLHTRAEELLHDGASHSNWGLLMLDAVAPFHEVAIVGKSVNEKLLAFHKHYLPNVIFALSETASALPLLQNRYVEGRTLIYVCRNNACQLPVTGVEDALKQMD